MASKRRVRRRECGDKRTYATPEEASHAIRWLHIQSTRNDVIGMQSVPTWLVLQAYRCSQCGQWHIGHGRRKGR